MRYNKFNKNEKEIFIMAILVTGGAGYIGSHTCVELLDACLLYTSDAADE